MDLQVRPGGERPCLVFKVPGRPGIVLKNAIPERSAALLPPQKGLTKFDSWSILVQRFDTATEVFCNEAGPPKIND
jgi:hypothetical protein